LQSLFLAAIGEARDKGAKALETFAYHYPEGESQYERFQVHKTIFPRDFMSDFGFRTVRTSGPVGLVRLEFGGLIPVAAGKGGKRKARGGVPAGRRGVLAGAGAAETLDLRRSPPAGPNAGCRRDVEDDRTVDLGREPVQQRLVGRIGDRDHEPALRREPDRQG